MANAPRKSRTPSKDDTELLTYFTSIRAEAEEARRQRLVRNRLNWDMYFGYQDYSHKADGQSQEFLPKMAEAAENMRAFVKKALVGQGDWFSVDVPNGSPLNANQVRDLMQRYLMRVCTARDKYEMFASLMGKSTLQGLFESLVILKVHGYSEDKQSYTVEPGHMLSGIEPTLKSSSKKEWRLRMDLIPTEDYFPDPTGRNLYEIHEVERDFIDVLEMAEAGIYDMKVVEDLEMDYSREDKLNRRLPRHRGQSEAVSPKFRRRVLVSECWGCILDKDGHPIGKNQLWTVANQKHIIRKPIDNPFWHKESPIVVGSIINVPHSVWNKAFYDHTAQLNIAVNELFNLILDGGISSVWGVREVRPSVLVDESQISNGIPAGATLVIKEDTPADVHAVEITATGKVPPDSLAVLNLVTREHDASAMTNDTRMGFLPQRQVKATEIQSADQSHSMLLDSFSTDMEGNIIEPVLRKGFLTMLQFADDLNKEDVIDTIGVSAAFRLHTMSKAERFATFSSNYRFKVNGLSSTLGRARDFQKKMAFMQGVQTNPILNESFVRTMNGDKALKSLMRDININPEDFELTEDEAKQVPQRVQNMSALQQALPPGGGSPPAASGGPSMQQEVQQHAEPSGGLGT